MHIVRNKSISEFCSVSLAKQHAHLQVHPQQVRWIERVAMVEGRSLRPSSTGQVAPQLPLVQVGLKKKKRPGNCH